MTGPTVAPIGWPRRLVAAIVSLAALPLLPLLGYRLAWFAPYADPASTVPAPGEAAPPPHATTIWYALLAALTVTTVGLALSWRRLRHPAPAWWLLPTGALAGLGCATLLADRLY
ncbi:hypothetical protein K7640_03070 [Micromonospora sp. PLK6-60]|uniref:hypothetical protein n=1 Tax=Micromonospora sp. PLK6-60 TaxID=2873383 RepID=UPI001CA65BCB|nr:hypothetical protein [Micromonospora sp. PLK6-60]MBY8870824.1 hypothetical protein [Micromonospora sp. PLK6-60]